MTVNCENTSCAIKLKNTKEGNERGCYVTQRLPCTQPCWGVWLLAHLGSRFLKTWSRNPVWATCWTEPRDDAGRRTADLQERCGLKLPLHNCQLHQTGRHSSELLGYWHTFDFCASAKTERLLFLETQVTNLVQLVGFKKKDFSQFWRRHYRLWFIH